MGLINSVITWFLKQRIDQIQKFVDNPVEVQQNLLFKLIETAQDTELGRQYDFKSIKTIEEFKDRVPILDYDGMKPYIERVMKGEQNLIWPTDIKWFAKSSGTTSDKSKFIPVTSEALEDCHFKGGKDLMAVYCQNNADTNIFSGKGVIMGGSTQVNKFNDDSYYGDVSAVMMKNMPWLANIIKVPDISIALMEDYEKKIDLIAQETINKNITHLVGVPTWTIVLIHKIFEITGKDNLADVWPNLELYIHGGVSFTPYRDQFNKLIRKSDMHYMETYNASEGFFAIQYKLDKPEMLLMLDYGIFFEFMPMSELGNSRPKTLQLSEVELNTNYALIISTNGGLWRYMIGDTIQFTSKDPYLIKVSGRTKHFINAFGEEVIVENADKAIAEASAATGAIVNDYTAGPIYIKDEEKGGHEWFIEFEKEPADLNYFIEKLDAALREANSDYDAKRYKNMALKMPVVHAVGKGFFYEWLKSKGKLGGQNKVPRLSNDRNYLDELLEFNKPE